MARTARRKATAMEILAAGWGHPAAARTRGGLVALIGLGLVLSMATWNAADPSLNVSSPAAPTNIFGGYGAAAADIGMQSLGPRRLADRAADGDVRLRPRRRAPAAHGPLPPPHARGRRPAGRARARRRAGGARPARGLAARQGPGRLLGRRPAGPDLGRLRPDRPAAARHVVGRSLRPDRGRLARLRLRPEARRLRARRRMAGRAHPPAPAPAAQRAQGRPPPRRRGRPARHARPADPRRRRAGPAAGAGRQDAQAVAPRGPREPEDPALRRAQGLPPSRDRHAAQGQAARLGGRRGGAAPERPAAGERAGRVRDQRQDRPDPPRPGRHPLRAGPGRRREVRPGRGPVRRHRALDERGRLPRLGGAGPQRHRHRAAQPQARDRLPARPAGLDRVREDQPRPAHGAGRDHRRRPLHRRPRAHAAPADRRHHRLGQVGRRQRHDPVDPLPAGPAPVPDDHDRPEDARAVRLRRHPAPAGARSSPTRRRPSSR